MATNPYSMLDDVIEQERLALDDWLNGSYAGREHQRYCGENDASYPHWDRIDGVVSEVLERNAIQQVTARSMDSLLFFISRSDEIGYIVAWLSRDLPLSQLGALSLPDLRFLADQALSRSDDFCDYQLASSFKKFQTLGDMDVTLLLRFFDRKYAYTRRVALHAFQHFGHPLTVDLASRLWESVVDADPAEVEFTRLSCLEALKDFPVAKHTFNLYLSKYLETYDIEAQGHRRAHLNRLIGDS